MADDDADLRDVLAVLGLGVAGVAGTAIARTRKMRILTVGESGSGKTTFANYMTGLPIPIDHQRTQSLEEKPGERIGGVLSPTLLVTDVVGGPDGWKDAKNRAAKTKLLCYFLAWPHLANRSDNLVRGAEQVGSWDSKARRVVIVTFRDQAFGITDGAVLEDPTVKAVRQRLGASHGFVVDQTDELSRVALQRQVLSLVST